MGLLKVVFRLLVTLGSHLPSQEWCAREGSGGTHTRLRSRNRLHVEALRATVYLFRAAAPGRHAVVANPCASARKLNLGELADPHEILIAEAEAKC